MTSAALLMVEDRPHKKVCLDLQLWQHSSLMGKPVERRGRKAAA